MKKKIRKTIIDFYRTKQSKGRAIDLEPTHSKDADSYFLKLGMLFDILSTHYKDLMNKVYVDKSNIVYLPLPYVEFLHDFVVKLYAKSEDLVVTGYMSRDNLDYTMDHVKYIYHNIKERKDKLIRKAAFIMYNITSKHPFTDGNKRTAILTCNSFLEYNGYTICHIPFRKSYKFITEVAIGVKKEIHCRGFIRKHISKLVLTERTKKEIKRFHNKAERLLKKKTIRR